MQNSWNEVVKDMLDRNEFGASKYNRYLSPEVDVKYATACL